MRAPLRRALAALLLSLAILGAGGKPSHAAEPDRRLVEAKVFPLARGVNEIANFDGLGHRALVIYAWRENFDAHGYGRYTVLLPAPDSTRGEEAKSWGLVTFETHDTKRRNGADPDSLIDSPFDGEETLSSVRFLKAKWRGHPATLAVTARRDLSHTESYVDRAPVDFSIYQLTTNEEGVPGWPPYYFDRVAHFRAGEFCNADLALTHVLGLPLPVDYQGPNKTDGCIAE